MGRERTEVRRPRSAGGPPGLLVGGRPTARWPGWVALHVANADVEGAPRRTGSSGWQPPSPTAAPAAGCCACAPACRSAWLMLASGWARASRCWPPEYGVHALEARPGPPLGAAALWLGSAGVGPRPTSPSHPAAAAAARRAAAAGPVARGRRARCADDRARQPSRGRSRRTTCRTSRSTSAAPPTRWASTRSPGCR